MAIGEARRGYELWRPNREKASCQTTRFVVILLLLVSVALMLIIALGGWEVLNGGARYGFMVIAFSAVYLLLAYMVFKWSRGAISLIVALAVLTIIFCAVGAGSWFARDKPGFTEAALPSDLIGVFVLILIPVQIALAVASAIAVNQEWHVEEERPIGSGDEQTSAASSAGPDAAAAPSA